MSLTLEEVAGARSQVCGPEVCVCRGVKEAATGSPAWREHRWGVQGKRRVREGVRVPHVRMPRGFRKWRGERKTAVKRVQREREGRREGGRQLLDPEHDVSAGFQVLAVTLDLGPPHVTP